MSKPMPKRLVDLSLAESDSEDTDFKTPIKRVTRRLPKKTSELTVVDSETEEDEEAKDNLNLAINLNDSFIFTPSKMLFSPVKPTSDKGPPPVQEPSRPLESTKVLQPVEVVEPPRAPPLAPKCSIFSMGSRSSIQENDKNLVNLHVKKDFSAELDKLAIDDIPTPSVVPSVVNPPPTTMMTKSNSTSSLQGTQGLKKKINDDHVDIIRYRPINQKRVQQQKQTTTSSSWQKSNESSSGDSGVGSSFKLFPSNTNSGGGSVAEQQQQLQSKDVPDLSVNNNNKTHDPVFATPGITRGAPVQLTGSRRVPNPRMPVTSATKNQSAMKEEFQQRKVLFTTPMGSSCKPVSSIANASISLALDESIQFATRLPDVSEMDTEPMKGEFPKQNQEKENSCSNNNNQGDRRQIRRIKNRDYSVEKKIGHGGSSTVFLARQLDTDKEVALKVVDLQGDNAIISGYLKETELLASLQGNPNIITLFDYQHSEKESLLYMVMEKGETDLHKILQTYRADIPLYNLMRYWYEMLLAVDFIHQQGVIHLDLKPANFLMVDGRLKLIDFGIAAKINTDATSIVKDSQAGTFNYISPEALTDTSDDSTDSDNPKFKISTKSDVWSLGCILYSLIYKRTPFAHIKNVMLKVATITNPINDIQYPELPMYYPPFLIKMLKACLKHNPKERASVQDILKFPFDMIIPI